ncbi:MAG: LysM peptidoglycan-binding domain-containing protein [Chloroflexi bacterium]|nr:LysM peptidoglycan-binding domain-containing protein [Chloroflexota bacterium]MCI0784124.1 LysM peptidoglycan-binding domain-containing protein [Chloroflexota bacterium]MCI0819773.1 LysM peptidoglycan-binding domain-containing protein [Chloroflexota bacterium]MCI0884466.1 LysM peptidoglycan-binding domain-containing protein [Chloroflexota bacterium]MCI0885714.1 LysM peptidoglycan-binding domain-containing protein [Chloroflexota bacterium]
MNMPPPSFRWITFALVLLVPALVALAACGGDDDDGTFEPGNLTDPDSVPSATPWTDVPDVVILDPDNINPLPPDSPNQAEPTETPEPIAAEPGACGETYTVEAGDTFQVIGEKCGVDWQLIAELNPDVDSTALSIGQVLILPPPDDGETE